MCCAPEEDTEHVLQCKGEAAKDLWEEKQWELVKRMFKIHTNSAMIMAIICKLNGMKQGKQREAELFHLPTEIKEAVLEQR